LMVCRGFNRTRREGPWGSMSERALPARPERSGAAHPGGPVPIRLRSAGRSRRTRRQRACTS
jgi:hypothetical protein